ncbi:MAG TPA: SRPBCC domain-containing protein [Kofleriaceae bacterium]|nr:SRPBCC domain-containing protein [Kofleriaceae bacterium]
MYTIETSIVVAASAETIRAAMTTRDGFRAWLADDTQVDSAGRYRFAFAHPHETRVVTFSLDRADDRGIAMTCVAEQNNPDWLGTELAITLTPLASGKTRVDLAHSGYRSKNECYTRCIGAWTHFVASLAKFAMTGMGEPYKATGEAVAS